MLGSHFYGELTKTEEGCQLLRAKGHFSDYARFIREHCAESKDPNIIGQLKSILWAVVSPRLSLWNLLIDAILYIVLTGMVFLVQNY